MAKQSAGILLFRRLSNSVQVLLVHLGGPFWKNRDDGAWSIPKGLYDEDEQPFTAAKREFQEETGCIPHGTFIVLASTDNRAGSASPEPAQALRKIVKGQVPILQQLFKMHGVTPPSHPP